jgi:hypothetical protein
MLLRKLLKPFTRDLILGGAIAALCGWSIAASAEPESPTDWGLRLVKERLLEPLEARRGGFSRGGRPARELRIRVSPVEKDPGGRQYLPFSVDERTATGWREAYVLGCVYRANAKMFVLVGDEYYPAAMLLGEDAKPVRGVCEPKADA